MVVYPNPNSGQFQFYTDLPSETSFQFQVIDISGRIIQLNSGKGQEIISVDISSCSSGTYILCIITPQSTANKKLEKQNHELAFEKAKSDALLLNILPIEIAEELNIPIGTVKTRIHVARGQLKKYLKNYSLDRA